MKSLVHSIWSDAIGELTSLLNVPVERLKLEDIDKAEGILQAIREILDKNERSLGNVKKYSDEFYSLIPHNEKNTKEINTKRVIAEKQDLCQVCSDWLRLWKKVSDWTSEQWDVFENQSNILNRKAGIFSLCQSKLINKAVRVLRQSLQLI